jgi:hypothetical protein
MVSPILTNLDSYLVPANVDVTVKGDAANFP